MVSLEKDFVSEVDLLMLRISAFRYNAEEHHPIEPAHKVLSCCPVNGVLGTPASLLKCFIRIWPASSGPS
jgi:hypothetical protein